MLASEESGESSDDDNSLNPLAIREAVNRQAQKEQRNNNKSRSKSRSRKSSVERMLESLPLSTSNGMRRTQSSLGMHLQNDNNINNSSSQLLGAGTIAKMKRRGSTGSNRMTLKKMLSESSLGLSGNLSGSSLGYRHSSMANDSWGPTMELNNYNYNSNARSPRSGRKRPVAMDKRGLLLQAAEDEREEGKDTIAPLGGKVGGKGNNKNIFKQGLKRFGSLNAKSSSSSSQQTDATQDSNNKQLRNFFQKATSMRIGKSAKSWDDFDEIMSQTNGSDEFSLHSMRQSSHASKLSDENSSSLPKPSSHQQQQPQNSSRPAPPPAEFSSLGQSLRRLNEISRIQNNIIHNNKSNNNNGSSGSLGLSVDADYSVASPTLWRENSEEMKPGLQFAPSAVASLLAQQNATTTAATIPQQQPQLLPTPPQTKKISEEPKNDNNNIGQSSSFAENHKPPVETNGAVDETIKPKAPESASPEVVDGTAAATTGGERPTRKLKRVKSKNTTSRTPRMKKKKAGSSSRKINNNIINGEGGTSDENDEELVDSPNTAGGDGQSKKSKRSHHNGRRKRKGKRRHNKGKKEKNNNGQAGGDNNDTEDEADENQSLDEDSDIQSVTSGSYSDFDDFEKPTSFNRSFSRSRSNHLSAVEIIGNKSFSNSNSNKLGSSQHSEKLSKSQHSEKLSKSQHSEAESKPQSFSKSSKSQHSLNPAPPPPPPTAAITTSNTKSSSSSNNNNNKTPKMHHNANTNNRHPTTKKSRSAKSLSPKPPSKKGVLMAASTKASKMTRSKTTGNTGGSTEITINTTTTSNYSEEELDGSYLDDVDDEESRASRRRSRRSELRESSSLFGSDVGSPKARRRKSLGGTILSIHGGGVGDKKGYIKSFLGSSQRTER